MEKVAPNKFQKILETIKKDISQISPAQANQKREKDRTTIFLDVRNEEEWQSGVIAGSLKISRGFLELQVETVIQDKSQPIICYCAGGTRSLLAAQTLKKLGYRDIASMEGGIKGWKEEGLPLDTTKIFSSEQRVRYGRHLQIPEVGPKGQEQLIKAKVLIVGLGGLGSPAAFYLAAAGVGTIGLVDFDVVELSNLQRQILHTTDRVGMPKVASAKKTLLALNPNIKIETYNEKLTKKNAKKLFQKFDIIIDGSDNFTTRYLINDVCVELKKPYVHGSIYRFDGQVTFFYPGKGPCYRCCYPEAPPSDASPSCDQAGVLGVLPGVIGVLEAVEAIKFILQQENLIGRIICYEALSSKFREIKIEKNPKCSCAFFNNPKI